MLVVLILLLDGRRLQCRSMLALRFTGDFLRFLRQALNLNANNLLVICIAGNQRFLEGFLELISIVIFFADFIVIRYNEVFFIQLLPLSDRWRVLLFRSQILNYAFPLKVETGRTESVTLSRGAFPSLSASSRKNCLELVLVD